MIRFILHYLEMCLAMIVGMTAFMAIPGVMDLPRPLHLVGMAIAMTVPMLAWMLIRGHSLRNGIEMSIGMLAPWIAVLVLVALGAASVVPGLEMADTPAMFLGMFAVMVLRPGHPHAHTPAKASAPGPRIRLRHALLACAYLAAVLLVPVGATSANLWHKLFDANMTEQLQPPAYAGALPAPPVPDPSKKIAVVLSGPRGAEINDLMDAYEVLSRSGLYNVYTVAPERTPLPLLPGPTLVGSSLDFVPHYSFAEYDALIGRAPDLIAIPWFDVDYTPQRDAGVLAWIRAHFGSNTTILGICSGDMILADTGLLANRTATSNTGTWAYVESHSPTTNWQRNVRYVDDGNIITTSNLTSGIPGALHVVDRFGGRAKALEVASQIGYTHTEYLDNPAFVPPSDSLVGRLALAGLVARNDQVGVLLYDGVTELGLSGLIDPFLGTFTARTYAIAPERKIVYSRGGLQLLPRYTFDSVPTLDRVLVPAGESDAARHSAAAAWARVQPSPRAEDLYANVGRGQSAYDISFQDVASTRNDVVARIVSSMLFYPADAAQFHGSPWPVGELFAFAALMLLGVALVFGATHLKRSRAQLVSYRSTVGRPSSRSRPTGVLF